MEHLINHLFNEIYWNLRDFVFRFVHVSIMLVGYYTGFSINRFLKIISKGHKAEILGATMSHIITDFVASNLDPHLRNMIIGIVIEGIVPLLFIPIFEKLIFKRKNHIVASDHEDVKKDLEDKHSHK